MQINRSADHTLQVGHKCDPQTKNNLAVIHILAQTFNPILILLLNDGTPGVATARLSHTACTATIIFVLSHLIQSISWMFSFNQVAISGVLRGSGRQYVGAIANFVCYDVIGLPLGVVLAFKARMGTIGLWTGLAAGNIIQVCVVVM